MSRPARSAVMSLVSVAVLLSGVILLAGAARAAQAPLVPLVENLPWRHVSGMIGYDGRLWFVNSRKYVNHNSADIYSYDPAAGQARYERHLFSQDAGDPVVSGGLLYWPFEDSRWSPGRGEFMVTNGRDWRWGLLPEGQAFHVHAMADYKGALFAAPSAWLALLERSRDGGTTWRQVYAYPAPKRSVSRIVALEGMGGTLYGGVTAWHNDATPKLLRWSGGTFVPVEGWPGGQSVSMLAAYRGWLYGDNVDRAGSAVWRTDGRRVERVSGLDGVNVRALAAGEDAIWAVSSDAMGGALYRSADGQRWKRVQTFKGPRPADVAVLDGRVYVGARGAGGGMLLGPRPAAPTGMRAGPKTGSKSLPRGRPAPETTIGESLARLDAALADPTASRRLRTAMLPIALSDDPAMGAALARRLAGPLIDGEAAILGGHVKVRAAKLARWYLMWAMGHNGYGRVPLALITEPWTQQPNRSEKYIDAPPGAAWTAAELGQNDAATLNALMARLKRAGDPRWLTGDVIGALSVLTGKRFGYDLDGWRRWWSAR